MQHTSISYHNLILFSFDNIESTLLPRDLILLLIFASPLFAFSTSSSVSVTLTGAFQTLVGISTDSFGTATS